MTAGTAAKIWTELECVHRAQDPATQLALCQKFLMMKKEKGQPMSQWIADVWLAAFHLWAIGVQIDDEDLILILTMGLPPFYKTFVVALDATPAHDLTLDNVILRYHTSQ